MSTGVTSVGKKFPVVVVDELLVGIDEVEDEDEVGGDGVGGDGGGNGHGS